MSGFTLLSEIVAGRKRREVANFFCSKIELKVAGIKCRETIIFEKLRELNVAN